MLLFFYIHSQWYNRAWNIVGCHGNQVSKCVCVGRQRTHALFVKSRGRSPLCSGPSQINTYILGNIITYSFNVTINCTISSLAKSSNQCCKLSLLKVLRGVNNKIITIIFRVTNYAQQVITRKLSCHDLHLIQYNVREVG